jgi:hypothetical protein
MCSSTCKCIHKNLGNIFLKVQQLMGLQSLEPKLEFEGAKDEQNLMKIQHGDQWSKLCLSSYVKLLNQLS